MPRLLKLGEEFLETVLAPSGFGYVMVSSPFFTGCPFESHMHSSSTCMYMYMYMYMSRLPL